MRIKPVLPSLSALSLFALSLLTLSVLPAGPAHANLIVNGGFEQTTNGGNKQLAATAAAAAGTTNRTTLTGWTSSNGNDGGYNFVLNGATAATTASALRLRGDNNGFGAAPDGGNFFASDPLYYPGTLSQTVYGLSVGASYLLTFDYALAQQSGYSGVNTADYWQVGFGKDIQSTVPMNLADGAFSGWQSASMRFTATGASQVLSFLAKGSTPGAPPFMLLDGVALNASTSVPEPSTLSLLLGGIGVAGLAAWRRRRRQA